MKHWNSLQVDEEREVRVRSIQSLVMYQMLLGRGCHQRPLVAGYISRGVDRLITVAGEADFQLKPVVGPRAELHVAALVVVREVGDVDAARRLIDGRRDPENTSVTLDDRHHFTLFDQPLVGTATHHDTTASVSK